MTASPHDPSNEKLERFLSVSKRQIMSDSHHRHSLECACKACESAQVGICGQIHILEGGEPNPLACGDEALRFLQAQRSERHEEVAL